MRFSPLSAAQIADSKIPARAILVFTVAILFSGPALDRQWPLDSVFPDSGLDRGYDWFALLLTLAIFGLLMRNKSMSWRKMNGLLPVAFRPVALGVAYGSLIYLGYVSAVLLNSLSSPFEGTYYHSDLITGSMAISLNIDRLVSAPIGLWFGTTSACFIVPFTEEFIFRGLLLRRLLTKTAPVVATFLSSAVFALAHIDIALLFPFFAGVFYSVLYLRTGNLWLCIVAHGATNLTGFVYQNCLSLSFNNQHSVLGFRPTAILFPSFFLLCAALIICCFRALTEKESAHSTITCRGQLTG